MVECNADIFASLLDEDDDLSVSNNKLKELEDKCSFKEAPSNSNDLPLSTDDLGAKCLKEKKLNYDIDIFSELDKDDKSSLSLSNEKSIVHTNDTDSSDDEENKYFENSKYNSFGKAIKTQLKQQNIPTDLDSKKALGFSKNSSVSKNKNQISLPEKLPTKKIDVYSDPIFGIRIINPLISSRSLQMKMDGKVPVSLAKLKIHMSKNGSKDEDWVLAGVIVRTVTKTSQNGNQYIIWDISDLKEQLLSVPIFLFGRSYSGLWKTAIGSVVGILNPSCSKKDNSETLSLTVSSPDQVMIWGTSKDFALCRAMKKNGEKCSSFVNRSVCDFCVYHVKQEYKKYSSYRSELQSPFGERDSLRNKVLGKNEVFYGGKSYTAMKPTLPKRVKKVSAKDSKRLTQLGITVMENIAQPEPSKCGVPQFTKGSLVMKQLENSKQFSPVLTSNPKMKFVKPSPNSLKFRSDKNTSGDVLHKISANAMLETRKKSINLSSPLDNKKNSVPPPLTNEKTMTLNSPGDNASRKQGRGNTKDLNSFKQSDISFSLTQTPIENPHTDNSLYPLNGKEPVSNKQNLTEQINKKVPPPNPNGRLKNLFSVMPSLSDPTSKKKMVSKIQTKSVPAPVNPLQKKFNSLFEFTPLKREKQTTASPSTFVNSSTENIKLPSPQQNTSSITDVQSNFSALFKSTNNNNTSLTSNHLEMKETPNDTASLTHDSVSPRSSAASANLLQSPNIVSKSGNSSTTLTPNHSELKKTSNDASLTQDSVGPRCGAASARNILQSPNLISPASIHSKKMSSAKLRAIQVIKQQGAAPQKRKRDILKSDEETDEKDKPVFSELFLELMKKTTAHLDLVENERLRKEEEYFDKMGKKEALEEKMLNTYKVDCKAVKCLKCKYIWFSSSEVCKSEGHPIKVVDAVKRFFKCGNCGHRTVSLHMLPLVSCKQCHQTNWIRAPMIREKISKNVSQLSIRGGEQTFIHSSMTNANINLLVPDDE